MSLLGGSDTNTNLDSLNETNDHIAQTSGDLGLIRPRIDRGDSDVKNYRFMSIVLDGSSITPSNSPATTIERTAGLPNVTDTGGINYITFPTVGTGGQTLYFASTSASDTLVGTGARKISVNFLNYLWDQVTEEIILDGNTVVSSSLDNVIRVNKIFVSSVGTDETNQGCIFCSTTNDFTLGIPNIDIVSVVQREYGYSTLGIYSVPRYYRLYFTRGSYYTSATEAKTLYNRQHSTYPWGGSNNPNVNRIKLNVGDLTTSSSTGFNTSGSAAEFPCTDIEFYIKSTNTNVNYNIFWNTVLTKIEYVNNGN